MAVPADCIQVHTVQRGENLFRIARRYGTTYQALQRLNGIVDANRLYAGQQVCVQAATAPPVEWTEVQNIMALTAVRLRSGPGTNYAIVGSLREGATADVTGISPDHHWWQVRCVHREDGVCWVTADPNLTRPTELPFPGPVPGPIRDTGEAMVQSVTVQMLESYPPQPVAVLRGMLPDGCVSISEVQAVRESTTFRIRMTTKRRIDALCQPATVPFEESVRLDISGLPTGVYEVRVNDLSTAFDLYVDNNPGNGATIPVLDTTVRYVQAQVNLRMRGGPGTGYPIIGWVAEGQTALVTGLSLDRSWWRVICADDTVGNCFVSADPSLTQVTDGF
jgi:uncharacterized protein YraI